MKALIVVDAQNEFSTAGQRAVADHAAALDAIQARVARARAEGWPIAWVQHHNRPHESPAFVPGTWGAELSPGLGPEPGRVAERLFQKDVYGAFTRTGLDEWLRGLGVDELLVVGFYTHMCLSTTVREALVRDYVVAIDAAGTGARALEHPVLGRLPADEVRRSALLQLVDMGATLAPALDAAPSLPEPATAA